MYENTGIEAVISNLFPFPLPVSCCQTGQLWAHWATSPQQHLSLPPAPGKRGMSTSLRTCAITSYTNCTYLSWRNLKLLECLSVSLLEFSLVAGNFYNSTSKCCLKNPKLVIAANSVLLWQSTSHIPYPWPGSFEGQTNGEPGGLCQEGGGRHVRVSQQPGRFSKNHPNLDIICSPYQGCTSTTF